MKDSSFCKVAIHVIPGVQLYTYPTAILFTRKAELFNEPYPEKMLVLFFSNKMYQLFLPFNECDNHLIGKPTKILSYPILIDSSYFQKYGLYKSIQIDFSSDEMKKGQKLTQNFSFDEVVHFSNSQTPKASTWYFITAFFQETIQKVLRWLH